ncbi:MAG: excinuclease ABC subunit UvrA, partial [Candidatus Kapaibacterium sp.]
FDSIDATYKLTGGRVVLRNVTTGETHLFTNTFSCPYDGTEYQEPEPRLFSFNSPFGACPTCQGFGRSMGIDEDLVIPDKTKSLNNGAIHAFKVLQSSAHNRELIANATRAGIRADAPVASFSKEQGEWLWHGDRR